MSPEDLKAQKKHKAHTVHLVFIGCWVGNIVGNLVNQLSGLANPLIAPGMALLGLLVAVVAVKRFRKPYQPGTPS